MRWRLDVRWWFHGLVVFPNEVYQRTCENQPAAGVALSNDGVLKHTLERRFRQRCRAAAVAGEASNVLFAASGTFFAELADELRGYELRKGTVHFSLDKPVPVKLISRIAKLRAAGISATVKKGSHR